MIIPSVLAAFRSRFILLEAVVLSLPRACSAAATSASMLCLRVVRPAVEIPLIWRCLLSKAAATLLLKRKYIALLVETFLWLNIFQRITCGKQYMAIEYTATGEGSPIASWVAETCSFPPKLHVMTREFVQKNLS